MSRLQQTINQYRQALIRQEEAALAALEAYHVNTVQTIELALDRLYEQIRQAKKSAGGQLSPSWLYESKRLETIKQLIEGKIDQYGALAQETTARLQQSGVILGQDAAQALLRDQVPPGVAWSFGVPSSEAIARLVGATQTGSPLADLFAGFGFGAGKDAAQALVTGLTLGQNPRQIAPVIRAALEVPRYRALTIARTESIRAYRGANLETFRANEDVIGEWRWTAALQARTCAACLAMDGTLHDLDEEMGSHPNCRCTPVPITKPWDEILKPLGVDTRSIPESTPQLQTGEAWFNKQPDAVKRVILGPGKFEAFQKGELKLRDTVGHSNSPDWGPSIHEKSLGQILREKAAKKKAAEPPPPPPKDARLVAVENELAAKYSHAVFDFTGFHPDAAEEVGKQIQQLFDAYPDVARRIPYIGSGPGGPEGYGADWKDPRYMGTYGFIQSKRNAPIVYAPMFLNPRYFGNPVFFQLCMEREKASGWGSTTTYGGVIAHEFGHVVNFVLEQEGKGKSPPGLGFIGRATGYGDIATIISRFMDKHKKLGDNISGYAKSVGPVEAFPEAFAAIIEKAPAAKKKYARLLKSLLAELYPGGSTAAWTSPEPSKLTDDQWDTWDAFAQKYEI